MAASRLIILGVAVAAAGGAGYVAKNMLVPPPPEVIVERGPQEPAIELADVLVLTGEVTRDDATRLKRYLVEAGFNNTLILLPPGRTLASYPLYELLKLVEAAGAVTLVDAARAETEPRLPTGPRLITLE